MAEGGAAMPNLFMPWQEFFEEIQKQPRQKEWLHSALFNDHGALVNPSRTKEKRSVSPVFRVRRDFESLTDLRFANATRS
jgi:hypothetical protein